jgi:protein-S-isoprenylcysteine O-methyltransferase Ste14
MTESVRLTLIAFSVIFVAVGGYYRIQSQRSGERLDRTKEGWPILIGLRLTGLLTIGCVAFWFENPTSLAWSSWPVPEGLRWVGVVGFGCAVAWLIWMFHTLGRNLTDTVVTRRDAYFVDRGPYRFVRNPMYTGVLMIGISLGVALGTWIVPLMATVIFVFFALRTQIEERYLIERFGDRYRDYMKQVGRFFPKF